MMRIDAGDTKGKVNYRVKHVYLPCRETGLTLCYMDLFTDNKHNYKVLQENTNRNN